MPSGFASTPKAWDVRRSLARHDVRDPPLAARQDQAVRQDMSLLVIGEELLRQLRGAAPRHPGHRPYREGRRARPGGSSQRGRGRLRHQAAPPGRADRPEPTASVSPWSRPSRRRRAAGSTSRRVRAAPSSPCPFPPMRKSTTIESAHAAIGSLCGDSPAFELPPAAMAPPWGSLSRRTRKAIRTGGAGSLRREGEPAQPRGVDRRCPGPRGTTRAGRQTPARR